jgi:hypothetical protein
MALGDKHATLSFSGWPWAPDARKRGILETPVAPRHGEIIFFASPGPPAQENLALLMAISSQTRKGGPELVQKTTKNRARKQKTQTFADLALKLDFECLLNGVSTPTVPGICANMS